MLIDTSTEYGQRVQRRLNEETIIWLTTVRKDGQPISVPVWYLWDGESELLIYSKPHTPKLRNIADNPRVSVNFDSDGSGGNIVQFDGEAHADIDAPAATGVDAFIEKYRDGIERIGTTPEGFASTYSVAVRIQLTKNRGF
ncbi:MAG: TIGR03667 family PPOX class F420-dependent oxidoreductase [Thermomicrobiales bacterium]